MANIEISEQKSKQYQPTKYSQLALDIFIRLINTLNPNTQGKYKYCNIGNS